MIPESSFFCLLFFFFFFGAAAVLLLLLGNPDRLLRQLRHHFPLDLPRSYLQSFLFIFVHYASSSSSYLPSTSPSPSASPSTSSSSSSVENSDLLIRVSGTEENLHRFFFFQRFLCIKIVGNVGISAPELGPRLWCVGGAPWVKNQVFGSGGGEL